MDDDIFVETGLEETGDTDTDEDAKPCAIPEEEPNGSANQALILPLETKGCGTFVGDLDLDYWLIDFEHEGWLQVSVDARAIGSLADPGLLLSSDGGMSAHMDEALDDEDIRMIFPTGPDRFHAMVAELQAGQGGEGHDYEIMASWAKVPISYNRDESEPNDDSTNGQLLESGDRVLGWFDDSLDVDWFAVDLPAGKQTLEIDIDAWEVGSAGNFKVILYDESGTSLGTYLSGETGWEQDPLARISVPGNQRIVFRVAEEQDRSSAMCWYLLKLKVEGGE